MKVSDSLENVLNENVVTQLVTNRPTNQLTDQLLELLEWLIATKNVHNSSCKCKIYQWVKEMDFYL